MMPLVPQLDQIARQIDAINTQAQTLCDRLSEDQLAWRPRPNQWSIAENLLHLEVTTAVMLPAVDKTIADARSRNLCADGPFSLGWLGQLYVWYSEPPPKIKLPAPKKIRPLLTGPATQALPAFLASQRQMAFRLDHANGLDLSRVRFQSPLAAYIHMNLLALFSVFTAHQRRHIAQAAAARELIR